MVFPGFKSNNWILTGLGVGAFWVATWEFCAAYMSPIGAVLFPQVMGRYDAGVVKGVNERGNRQYLRPKVAWDSQVPDYSKYIEESGRE